MRGASVEAPFGVRVAFWKACDSDGSILAIIVYPEEQTLFVPERRAMEDLR